MVLLWDSAFIKTEIVFRNFVPRQLLATWGFPAENILVKIRKSLSHARKMNFKGELDEN